MTAGKKRGPAATLRHRLLAALQVGQEVVSILGPEEVSPRAGFQAAHERWVKAAGWAFEAERVNILAGDKTDLCLVRAVKYRRIR